MLPRGCVVSKKLLLLFISPRQVALTFFSLRPGQGETQVVPEDALLPCVDQLGLQILPSSSPGPISPWTLRVVWMEHLCLVLPHTVTLCLSGPKGDKGCLPQGPATVFPLSKAWKRFQGGIHAPLNLVL